ncbi:MAG: FecR domain-containing protein [Eubacterium sp.]|nr:FecR domain-containing protein [Eubacterium sp.]
MKFKEFLKTKKGKVVTIGGVSVVAVGIAVAVILQGLGYRSILVQQVEGIVDVIGERNNGQAYSGERLYSGDDVTVKDESSLTMCMDNDKYVYADANTHFTLESSSNRKNSRIRINLDKGSELNVLKSKLKQNDYYEVGTPNSTMSVRGTTFRMTVYEEGGLVYTLLEVEEGIVLAQLMTEDGTFTGVEKAFKAGENALIRGNYDFSEFVMSEEGSPVWYLDYSVLPEDGVERLIALLKSVEEEGEETEEELTTEEPTEATTEAVTEEPTPELTEEPTPEPTEKTTEKTTQKTTQSTTEEKTEEKTEKTTEKEKSKKEKKTTHTHSFGDWETVKEPTCTEAGLKQRKCSCGETESETIAPLGHSWSDWSTDTEPTCEGAGSRSRYCQRCQASESETIDPLGHDWVETERATDSSTGEKYVKYKCRRCNAERKEYVD